MAQALSEQPGPAGAPTDASDARQPARPKFATVEEERLHRKQKLAGALRLFGRFGFSEGVAGHITARDPELTDHFWVNPFGMSFRHVRVSDLILVSHTGEVVEGSRPVNPAAFAIHSAVHAARPDVDRRRARPLGLRQGVVRARAPARSDHPGRLRLLRGPHRVRGRRRRHRAGGGRRQGAGGCARPAQGHHPPQPRAVHRRAHGRRGGLVVHHHGALLPGPAPGRGGRDTGAHRRRGGALHARPLGRRTAPAGSRSSRLWDEISRSDPDLFD